MFSSVFMDGGIDALDKLFFEVSQLLTLCSTFIQLFCCSKMHNATLNNWRMWSQKELEVCLGNY